jgi:hypothetical protein
MGASSPSPEGARDDRALTVRRRRDRTRPEPADIADVRP